MSEENVEIVRQVYEAVARRDSKAVLALYDPEVEVRSSADTVFSRIAGGGTFRGYAGLRAFDQELRQAFEGFETNYEELVGLGSQVLSVSRYRARGRRSGIEIEGLPQFGIWTLRNAQIIRVEWFKTREQALEAAGLSE